jgi:hypothetical protein
MDLLAETTRGAVQDALDRIILGLADAGGCIDHSDPSVCEALDLIDSLEVVTEMYGIQ